MRISSIPLRIAQFSDIHCGEPSFREDVMQAAIERINGWTRTWWSWPAT